MRLNVVRGAATRPAAGSQLIIAWTQRAPALVGGSAGACGGAVRGQWLRGKPRSTPAGASAGSGQRVVTTLPRV